MTTRNLKFLGHSTHADLTVKLGTQIVFNGSAANGPVLFEVSEFPMEFAGTVPMTIAVNTGTVTLKETLINYQRILNPIYNDQQRFKSAKTWAEQVSIISELADPAFSQDQIEFLQSENLYNTLFGHANFYNQEQLLYQHGCNLTMIDRDSWAPVCVGESRSNIVIDGYPQLPQRGPDENGTWECTITSGSVLSCDLKIDRPKSPAEFLGKYQLPRILVEMLPRNRLKHNSKIKILDLGVGDGQIGYELHQQGISSELHGLDVTNKRRTPIFDLYDCFIIADITQPIPVADEIYDVAICSNLLGLTGQYSRDNIWKCYGIVEDDEYQDYPIEVTANCLEEILRILRPDAIFVFSVTRVGWREFDLELTRLKNAGRIQILEQSWEYHRDGYYMFPPIHMCVVIEKIK
jgi:SAM-dependent methyltransferase